MYDFGKGPFYEIVSNYVWFFGECVEQIIKANYDTVRLSVTSQDLLTDYRLKTKYDVVDVSCYYDLRLLNNLSKSNKELSTRKLTKDDRAIAERFECEPAKGRPPFMFLFEHFVAKENGTIYSVVEGEEIKAFLSCYTVCAGICDVDYIYVTPNNRGLGYGTELIKNYAHDVLNQGITPIYSHAVSEHSVNAAIKAGFDIVTTVYSCSLKKLE